MKKTGVAIPALTLFVITFVVNFLSAGASFHVISAIVMCAITEALAYLSCWALVLRKNKGQQAVWVNYIVWIVLMNLGSVVSLLGIAD